ncbi:hypothetical protein A2U01_0105272, partial [Trifolium medium]|nr:hypothetical protein [Trifolium medium]
RNAGVRLVVCELMVAPGVGCPAPSAARSAQPYYKLFCFSAAK